MAPGRKDALYASLRGGATEGVQAPRSKANYTRTFRMIHRRIRKIRSLYNTWSVQPKVGIGVGVGVGDEVGAVVAVVAGVRLWR